MESQYRIAVDQPTTLVGGRSNITSLQYSRERSIIRSSHLGALSQNVDTLMALGRGVGGNG